MTFSMKKNELDDEPVLEIVSQDNQTIAFAPADTTGIDYGSYVYTVKVETDKGKVFTVVGPACFEVIPFQEVIMNNIVKGILNQEGFINVGPQKDLIYGYVDEKGDLYLISDSPFGFD